MTALEKKLSEALLDLHQDRGQQAFWRAEHLLARLGVVCQQCGDPIEKHTLEELADDTAAQVELAWSLFEDGSVCLLCGGEDVHADDCTVGHEIEADRAAEQNLESWDRHQDQLCEDALDRARGLE